MLVRIYSKMDRNGNSRAGWLYLAPDSRPEWFPERGEGFMALPPAVRPLTLAAPAIFVPPTEYNRIVRAYGPPDERTAKRVTDDEARAWGPHGAPPKYRAHYR